MISAPLLQSGIEVDLPKTRAAVLDDEVTGIIVTIDDQGWVVYRRRLGQPDRVRGQAQARNGSQSTTSVYLRGDSTVAYGKAINVIGRIKEPGSKTSAWSRPMKRKRRPARGGRRHGSRSALLRDSTRAAVAMTMFASPLNIRKPHDFGEVIRVGVVSMDSSARRRSPRPNRSRSRCCHTESDGRRTGRSDPQRSFHQPATPIEKPVENQNPSPKRPRLNPTRTIRPKPATRVRPALPRARSTFSAQRVGVSGMGSTTPRSTTRTVYAGVQQTQPELSDSGIIDGTVTCDVYFQVIKSGRVIEKKVVTPSGVPQFDQACLASIDRAQPFPPLPRDFLDEIIGLYITFSN